MYWYVLKDELKMRKSKLNRYYDELTNIVRQRPNAVLLASDVLVRLKEIKTDQKHFYKMPKEKDES